VPPLNDGTGIWHFACTLPRDAGERAQTNEPWCVRPTSREESDMRRAIIALVTALTLMLTGLTPGPLRVSALGETSVTLTCTDDTSITLLLDADGLADLTAAVQAMIDYPAGLNCTIIQNPLPLTVTFGHVALAANPNTMVVAGGRWLAPCSVILPVTCDPADPSCGQTLVQVVVARSASRPAFARIMPAPLASTSCPIDPTGCVWVNIGVNLHFRDKTMTPANLEGTLNETIPENQSCPGANGPVAVGPSHFTSKPTPSQNQLTGCLFVLNERALTTTYVTQVFGPVFTAPAANALSVDSPIHFRFSDKGNPSRTTDLLGGPPGIDEGVCETPFGGSTDPRYPLENGNINIYGKFPV
jgi:hypothetical protein